MDLGRLAVSVAVGIITWVVVAFLGLLVSKYLDGDIGNFISSVSVLFGVLAAVWHWFTGKRLV